MKTNLHRFSISIKKMQLPRFNTAYIYTFWPLYPHIQTLMATFTVSLTHSISVRHIVHKYFMPRTRAQLQFSQKIENRGALPPFCTATAGFLDITILHCSSS